MMAGRRRTVEVKHVDSIARKRVSVLSRGVLSSPGYTGRREWRPAAEGYRQSGSAHEPVTREELIRYRKDLVTLLADLVCLFLPPAWYGTEKSRTEIDAGVIVTDIQVRSRIRTGERVPVDVTVYNRGKRQEWVELTLADTTENIILGRQILYLPPAASRVAHFEWKTTGFRLGDHILEAQTAAACY